MPSGEGFIRLFLTHILAERRLSKRTASTYSVVLFELMTFLRKRRRSIAEAREKDLEDFQKRMGFQSLKSATIAKKISAVRGFYRFLHERGLIYRDPSVVMKRPRVSNRIPETLGENDVIAIFQAAFKMDKKNRKKESRWRASLIALLYGCGLRVSEAISVRRSNLDGARRLLTVIGKGGRERTIPVPDAAAKIISRSLEEKRMIEDPYVVSRDFGRSPITRSLAYAATKKLAAEAGVTMKVSPHILRHSVATHLLRRGVGIRLLQNLLGHRQLSTVQIYTHLDTRAILEEYDRIGIGGELEKKSR